jgi:hypothetical protein
MFIAAGWTLRKEKIENEKLLKQIRRQQYLEENQIRAS